MKRTYIRPQATLTAVADQPLCAAQSWGAGTYSGDGKQLDVDDPLTDRGQVITDKDLKATDYNPWDSNNW